MDTNTIDNQQQQEDELLVLKGAYVDDFIETPPPKAWKVCYYDLLAGLLTTCRI